MAALSISYDVESGVKSTFKTGVTAAQTASIVVKRALNITAGVLLVNRGGSTQEWISFNSTTVNGSETTLGDVVRGLALSGNTFTGLAGRAYVHGASETVELVDYHILLNLKANIDRANTWSADQLISSTNKWTFGSSANWIRFNGVNDLEFKSTAQAARTLSQLASLSGSNDKVKVTSSDTTEGYLDTKINPGSGLVRTVTSPAGNEGYTLDINLESSNPSLQVSSDQLGLKIKASGGLAVDSGGVYVDGTTITSISGTDVVSSQLYGETITANDSLFINGDAYTKKAQSDALTDMTFIGIAKQSGVLDQSKNVALNGVPATINTLSGSVANAKLFTGITQASSSTNVAVYDVNWYGQTFTPPTGQTNVANIILNLTKTGTPTGTYTLEIRATSGGVPTGAALATATLAVGSMASGDNTFVFTPYTVTPGTVYAMVFYNAAATVANHYKWNYATTNPYSGGQWCSSVDSGSSWAGNASNDFRFTTQYRGLPGTEVFLTDTAGTIDVIPGTYYRKIGKLLGATKLLMNESIPSIYATFTWSASSSDITVDTEISIGFRPRAMISFGVGGSSPMSSIGFWHYGMTGGQGLAVGGATTASTTVQEDNYFMKVRSSSGVVSDHTRLTVQATSADTITIRREMNDDTADAPGGTVYLMIFG